MKSLEHFVALLITGEPGIGKTTIVEKVAVALAGHTLRGFTTGEIRQDGRRVGFELATFDGRRSVLAHVDLRSQPRVGRYGVDVAALDAIAEAVLAPDVEGIYLVDEIGTMEACSAKFRSALRRLLDSGGPVIATIKLRGGGFIEEIEQRPDVELWRATHENRDELPARILSRLQSWLGSC